MSVCMPSTADVLRSIAHLLDAAAQEDGWHRPAQLVRVEALPRAPGDSVEFGVKPLAPGVHPLAVLEGFVAPVLWAGLGVVAEGRAWSTGPGQHAAGRMRIIELLARDGARVTAVRARNGAGARGGELTVEVWPSTSRVEGAIPLALCRALGVPVVAGRVAATGRCPTGHCQGEMR